MKILILEDILLTCNMLGAILESMFPEDTVISCAQTCNDFQEIYHKIKPNLLIIDYLFPTKTGAECFGEIFDQTIVPLDLPVVYYSGVPKNILTNKIDSYYITNNIMHKNYTILSKPFSLEEFYESIQKVITPVLRIPYKQVSQDKFLKRIDYITKKNRS